MSEHPTSVDSPEIDTAKGSVTAEELATCPLCSFTASNESALSTHLLTSHRKGTLAQVLVETI